MASLILAAGHSGERCALPNARIMLHQPSGGASVYHGRSKTRFDGVLGTSE